MGYKGINFAHHMLSAQAKWKYDIASATLKEIISWSPMADYHVYLYTVQVFSTKFKIQCTPLTGLLFQSK